MLKFANNCLTNDRTLHPGIDKFRMKGEIGNRAGKIFLFMQLV